MKSVVWVILIADVMILCTQEMFPVLNNKQK